MTSPIITGRDGAAASATVGAPSPQGRQQSQSNRQICNVFTGWSPGPLRPARALPRSVARLEMLTVLRPPKRERRVLVVQGDARHYVAEVVGYNGQQGLVQVRPAESKGGFHEVALDQLFVALPSETPRRPRHPSLLRELWLDAWLDKDKEAEKELMSEWEAARKLCDGSFLLGAFESGDQAVLSKLTPDQLARVAGRHELREEWRQCKADREVACRVVACRLGVVLHVLRPDGRVHGTDEYIAPHFGVVVALQFGTSPLPLPPSASNLP